MTNKDAVMVLKLFCGLDPEDKTSVSQAFKMAIKALEAEQRETAEWTEKKIFTDDRHEYQSARCSACKLYHTTPFTYSFDEFKYCPHCGARMGKAE